MIIWGDLAMMKPKTDLGLPTYFVQFVPWTEIDSTIPVYAMYYFRKVNALWIDTCSLFIDYIFTSTLCILNIQSDSDVSLY